MRKVVGKSRPALKVAYVLQPYVTFAKWAHDTSQKKNWPLRAQATVGITDTKERLLLPMFEVLNELFAWVWHGFGHLH